MNKNVFLTGGTGYIGSRIAPLLADKGYKIKALCRNGSEQKLPDCVEAFTGNALNSESYKDAVTGCDTFIHLVGVSHPGPGKEKEFNEIDLVSIAEAIKAAKYAGVKKFIYLSVAEPAPMMKEFISVRKKGEKMLAESGMDCIFIKPWYVLGPGHYWPYLFLPLYWVFMPFTDTAKRLYPVKLKSVLNAIIHSVENDIKGSISLSTKELRNF